jgi:hypothetical protein
VGEVLDDLRSSGILLGHRSFATMALVDSLRLAGVTGDSYSLVEMQSGSIANNVAFIEYDLAITNAGDGPKLVNEELLPAVFDVFRGIGSGRQLPAWSPLGLPQIWLIGIK